MKNARILIVDDDDHVREALFEELSPGYRVDAVTCGNDAFEAISARQYDVIISDLRMPDHDGIEVLEFARLHQHDAVRVLLTGYLDERAHRALLNPDAPYKVGKPWHDEIEVVVRRGLEHRDVARRLSASVEDALTLASFDDQLAGTTSPLELSECVVRRVSMVEGVTICGTVARGPAGAHQFTGAPVPRDGEGWYLDLPLDGEGDLRLQARGIGDSARLVVGYLAHRAQRRCGVLAARVAPVQSVVDESRGRVNQLMRQATLGALTSSLLHDMASLVQALSCALEEISALAEDSESDDMKHAVADAMSAGQEAVQLFVTMRKFIRAGELHPRPMRLEDLVSRATRIAGSYVRERATLKVGALAPCEVSVSEPLFLQVIANLLRNAANASPAGGIVNLDTHRDGDNVIIEVTDDGPGVDPAIADFMFEPFASTSVEGAGLGLAISAFVVQLHHGNISYRRADNRGARFAVSIPLALGK
jgi:signal transduction histidine kinase/AmiR/NasT family two-component response regulator